MKSSSFQVRLGEIRESKRIALTCLIKEAIAHKVPVHILIRQTGQVKYAWAYLRQIGFTEKNPGDSLLMVHVFTTAVPSDDLAIYLEDIYTLQELVRQFS